MNELDRQTVRREIEATFVVLHEPVSPEVIDILVLKIMQYYHQGAVDTIEDVMKHMPSFT